MRIWSFVLMSVYEATWNVRAALNQLATVYVVEGIANSLRRGRKTSGSLFELRKEKEKERQRLTLWWVIKGSRNNVFARARGCTHHSRGTWHRPRGALRIQHLPGSTKTSVWPPPTHGNVLGATRSTESRATIESPSASLEFFLGNY